MTGAAVGSGLHRAVLTEASDGHPPKKAESEGTVRPKASSALVSRQMSQMPRSSTAPEVALRKALHAAGLRFRLHVRALPGTPDIVFTRAKVAVFVDGCFWHACPEHGVLPKSNQQWWQAKLQRNRDRDVEVDAKLVALGWIAVHVWEHEELDDAVRSVIALWRARTDRSEGRAAPPR